MWLNTKEGVIWMEKKLRNPELQKLALEIFNQTGSGHEVARRLEIGSSTAYRLLHLAGADVPNHTDPKPRRRKLQDNQAEEIVADYLSGEYTFKEMVEKYGCGEWSIRRMIRRHTDHIKQRGGQYRVFTDDEKKEVLSLYTEGLTQAQISYKFSCSQIQISRILKSLGVTSDKKAKRERHGQWKGGRIIDASGYVSVLAEDYPEFQSMKNSIGYIREHRLIVALSLGRPLKRSETVHHINGDASDNRIENLQLRQGQHGTGVVMQCACCGSYDVRKIKIAEKRAD